VAGTIVGAILMLVVRGNDRLPREESILGTVTQVTSDGDAFGFETDAGEKIGLPIPGPPEEVDDIHVGAHLRLEVVEGSGYQVVVEAAPA
jgi:hypothetical protein